MSVRLVFVTLTWIKNILKQISQIKQRGPICFPFLMIYIRTVFATNIKFLELKKTTLYIFFNSFICFNIDYWTLSIDITNGIILVASTWSKNHMNNCHLLEYDVVKLVPNPSFKMATRTRLNNPQLNIKQVSIKS